MTEELHVNGLDGATGEYLLPPMDVHVVAQAIGGEAFARDQLKELLDRRAAQQPDFGTVYGQDPEDLAQAGWAVVAAERTNPEVIDALGPLLALRSSQAGHRYQQRTGAQGYRQGESKRDFLRRVGVASASPANPEKFPYYVLLVGGPEDIPFEFQYQLDVQYAVGRLNFDTPGEYARYAEAVVRAEQPRRGDRPRRHASDVALFGPTSRADRATKLSAEQLVEPLAAELRPARRADLVVGQEACKERLLERLCGNRTPSLLFTASHGVAFPRDDPRQSSAQGALLCADWPGPLLWRQNLREDFYVAAADLADDAELTPDVVFAFACYGAGTPSSDDYARLLGVPDVPPADQPFVARLPQRLLAHPRGGTLAFIGHVERAWGCSFLSPGVTDAREVFWCALQALLEGRRVGHAMEFFDDRYATLSAELHDNVNSARDFGRMLDDLTVTGLWTENNDARSYIVLGDPAVRLGESRAPDTRS